MTNTTNLADVAANKIVQTLELPGWDEDHTFVCKAKRPSLYNMVSMGLIPNPLLSAVQQMFSGNAKVVDAVPLDKQAQTLMTIAKYALVNPTYDQITEAGLELTDNQLLCLYSFALGGAQRLAAFRSAIRPGTGDDGDAVQGEAEQPIGD